VKILVLPPACFFVLFLIGLLLKKRWPRSGRAFLWAVLAVVYLSTTPYLAGELMAPLQPYGPVDPLNFDPEVGAIVVLGAGVYFGAPEYWLPQTQSYSVDTAGGLTLQRLQYAAFLAKLTDKPILVSGGATGPSPGSTVADAMRLTLLRDFAVRVRWVENQSESTFANGRFSAALLRAEGIGKIYLVTHAWHMPRAMIAFENTGLEVVPAPTRFVSRSEITWRDFLPSMNAFETTYYAVHEELGIAWYRLRG
jgi:uncharacterized SAM-binding protein YcdF (DUF218 family)